MNPIIHELMTTPMGWLFIGGTLIMLGMTIGIPLFLRKKMRESEKNPGKDDV